MATTKDKAISQWMRQTAHLPHSVRKAKAVCKYNRAPRWRKLLWFDVLAAIDLAAM